MNLFSQILSAQQIRDRSAAQEDISSLQMQKGESEALVSELEERLQSQATLIISLQEQTQALQSALEQTQSELGISSKHSEQFRLEMLKMFTLF